MKLEDVLKNILAVEEYYSTMFKIIP